LAADPRLDGVDSAEPAAVNMGSLAPRVKSGYRAPTE